MINRLYVMLGNLGDTVSFLPALYHEAKSGQKPALMVKKDIAPILEGCSYVDSVPFDGQYSDLPQALEQAQRLAKEVRSCHPVNGEPKAVRDSFVKEIWTQAGVFELWKEQPPLVFDRRDKNREKALVEQYLGKEKRKLVLIANRGKTSPFVGAELLAELIRMSKMNRYRILNISDVKAERFYDLLAFYDRARCLISVDTAALHLAQACPKLPVVALVQDKPSYAHGSPWRPNHIFHCRYSDFDARAVGMLRMLDNIDTCGSWFYPLKKSPRILHVYSTYEWKFNPHRGTWDSEYGTGHWVMCAAEKGVFGRDSKSVLGEAKQLPFVKDAIRMAALRARNNDIICLSRADIGFTPGLTDLILRRNPCYAHRSTVENDNLAYHPASDLFAFTKQFWNEHSKDLPDYVLSGDANWHRGMRYWMQQHNASALEFAVTRSPSKATVEKSHISTYNERLLKSWVNHHQFSLTTPKVTDQVDSIVINRSALFTAAYNPSLIRRGDRYLLSYRWHAHGTPSTELALAELDDKFNVKDNWKLELPGKSLEDLKFFTFKGEIWCSYVESAWPDQQTSIVRYGQLVRSGNAWRLEGQYQIQYGKNYGQHMEKNFTFFESGKRLFCLYQSQPEQILLEVEQYRVIQEWRTVFPHWKWGQVKGGVMAGIYKDKLLRFFHSTLDNEPSPDRRRYYLGAALMEPEPPFKTIALSSEPIARGSEADDLSQVERSACGYYKKQVIFPGGVVPFDGGWFVACGINDSACSVLKITKDKLNL